MSHSLLFSVFRLIPLNFECYRGHIHVLKIMCKDRGDRIRHPDDCYVRRPTLREQNSKHLSNFWDLELE